jgi:hypothetical protein
MGTATRFAFVLVFGTALLAAGARQGLAQCAVSPSILSFGDPTPVVVGNFEDQVFLVRNLDFFWPLAINIAAPCPHFYITPSGTFILPPLGGVTVAVRFAPSAPGVHVCAISLGRSCGGVTCMGVAEMAVPVPPSTWGRIKALYRN